MFPYQRRGAQYIRKFNGLALLADEMGLGKTIQTLYWILKMSNTRPVIVVCPAFVKDVWDMEIKDNLRKIPTVLSGRKSKRIVNHGGIIIVNYDILHNWESQLMSLSPKALVIDEAHFIKERSRLRSKTVKRMSLKIPYRIALSGTPVTNKPTDLWHILNVIRPDEYPSFPKFAWKWTRPVKKRWGWDYSRTKDIKKLHEHLKNTCMIRRTKNQVMSQLPEKTRSIVPLDIVNASEYKKADKDFLKWLSNISKAKGEMAKKAFALTKFGYTLRLALDGKMPNVMKWIDNYLEESDSKIVVFGHTVETLKELHKKHHKHSVLIYGGVPMKKRKPLVAKFHNDKNCRIFFGNTVACGTGINLTAASDLAFIEVPKTPAELMQAEDRIHRIGQKKRVVIHYLIAKNTIEHKITMWQQQRFKVFRQIMDGTVSDEQQLNIYNDLLENIRNEYRSK